MDEPVHAPFHKVFYGLKKDKTKEKRSVVVWFNDFMIDYYQPAVVKQQAIYDNLIEPSCLFRFHPLGSDFFGFGPKG